LQKKTINANIHFFLPKNGGTIPKHRPGIQFKPKGQPIPPHAETKNRQIWM